MASTRSNPDRRARRRGLLQELAVAAVVAGLVLGSAPHNASAKPHTPGVWGSISGQHAVTERRVASARTVPAPPRADAAASHRAAPRYPSSSRASTGGPVSGSSGSAPMIALPDLAATKVFNGLTQGESGGGYPADPWVAVSSAYVVQIVNSAVRISDRSGNRILTVAEEGLFAVPTGQFPGDGRILWDAAHGRWVGVVLTTGAGFALNYLILGVSDGSDPTAGWTLYQFAFANEIPDYPSIASSSDKIVLTDNLFDDDLVTYLGADILTVTWASILGGAGVAVQECFSPSSINARAAQVLSTATDVHVIMELLDVGEDQLYFRITGSGNCGAGQYIDFFDFSTTGSLNFAGFFDPPDPRQPGPDPLGNAVDGRPTDAVWMGGSLWWVSTWPRTFDLGATYNDEVVVWHAYTTPGSGAPTADWAWETTPGDGYDTFFGGVGLSRNGTPFVTYSQSSAADAIAWYANRIAGGNLGTPQLLDTSDATTAQNRWGDYAGVATDPVGTGTVWATHMLVANDGTWRTTVARLLFDTDAPTNPGLANANALMSKVLTSAPAYRVAWAASSDAASGTVTYLVEQSVDAGAWGAATWLTGTSLVRALPLGHNYRFRTTAFDPLGNSSGIVQGPLLTPSLAQSPTSKTGTWHTSSSSAYSGGTTWYASAAGASASYKTTGLRSIAIVTTKATSRGSFKVYIDGVYKATISTYATSTAYRQIVYQYTWSSPGTHTIKLVVSGTSGHPRVDVDGFLLLK